MISPTIRRLRRARLELGLPQKTVAALMGWSVNSWHVISQWENGRRTPAPHNLAKWRLALARERMARRT